MTEIPRPTVRADRTGSGKGVPRKLEVSGATASARAQREGLEELRRRYESISPAAADFFTVIDANCAYEEVNDAYCLAHGKPREEILGRNVADVWGAEVYRKFIEEPLRRCFAGDEIHYQARFEFPRTGLRHFEVSFFPRVRDGSVSHAIVVTRDITESRRGEEEVRLLLNLTRAVNEAQDFDTALQVSLRKICEATGWILGQAWTPSAEQSHLQCSPSWHCASAGLEKLRAISLQSRWKTGEGLAGRVWVCKQPLWVTDAMREPSLPSAYRNSEPPIRGVLAIPVVAGDQVVAVLEFCLFEPRSEDQRRMGVVSALAAQLGTLFLRKRSEEALRESEERYRTLIETAKDVIFRLGRDGKITSLNSAFEAVTGWSCREWIGKDFAPLLHPEDRSIAVERFQAILRGETPAHNSYRVIKKSGEYADGEFTVSAEVKCGMVVGVFGIAREVTERKQAEEALRQSEEHYRELFHEAYRMQENLRRLSSKILQVQEEERTRISRELHDEVGQALTAVSVNVAVMKREVDPGNQRFLKKIADSQALLSQTMETVHGFSRELRPALLDDLGLLAALRSYLKAFEERTGIRVHFRPAAASLIEAWDISRKTVVYRVAQESLNNIAKHAEAKRVTFKIRKAQSRIAIEIQDDGKGFSLEQRPTGKSPNRLGLLGMQERVRLVNGDFAVQSKPGEGTVIRVQIPVKA
ncbi:MAG: PAS domain S-box protein [Verrucomicrobia bacterium]|nr:PAS domain S-box protein [Verrucomicrobiota bacterium]